MAARKKADDPAPRRTKHQDIVEYAHTYEKSDRQNVPLWISNPRSSIVKVLSEFSNIEEVLAYFITSDQTNKADPQMDMKLVLANSLMFLVLENTCEDEDFMTAEICK